MVRFADLIAEHAEQIRYLETIVTGKPNAFSGFEVNEAVQNFKCTLCTSFLQDTGIDYQRAQRRPTNNPDYPRRLGIFLWLPP